MRVALVALHILPEFGDPKAAVRRWQRCKPAFRMTMPEATVHEHCSTEPGQDKIRAARHRRMKSESKTLSVKAAPDDQFGFRILASDAGHHSAASSVVNNVDHHRNGSIGCICSPRSFSIRPSTRGTMIRATSRIMGTTTLLPNCL